MSMEEPSFQSFSTSESATLSPESTTLSPASARSPSPPPQALNATKNRARDITEPFEESEEDFPSPKRFHSPEGFPSWIMKDVSNDRVDHANCEVTAVEYETAPIEGRVTVMDGGMPYFPVQDEGQASGEFEATDIGRWLHRDEDAKGAWGNEDTKELLTPENLESEPPEAIPCWDPFEREIREFREVCELSTWEQDGVPSEEELRDLMSMDPIVLNYPDADQEEAWNIHLLPTVEEIWEAEDLANEEIREEGERLVREQDTVPSEEERRALMDEMVPEYPDMDQEEAFYEYHTDPGDKSWIEYRYTRGAMRKYGHAARRALVELDQAENEVLEEEWTVA
ncbi:uncharacterized protein BDZ99DRAFT_469099 [Mytilinidion resinicola]|uniref:Uncharacterized protein n=1 Tax=Mytilinidion resinicola TaxID=574789 RepID=A0A6A6Y224_9PEZI|nr:uncharacterized protein BDZ99DRAFT_469099 [Mytilinidion resinicola]KAF2802054.1 hypothetical protein BDZ99DRAFT_469099 [Mytilinidion resinicola]